MTQAILSPEEAILCFQYDQFEGQNLAEALARYPYWQVPVGKDRAYYEPQIQIDENGDAFVNLFSKPEYVQLFMDKQELSATGLHLAESVGYYIFKQLPKRIAYINIDPETEHAIHYKKPQLKLLRMMGKMVEIDGMIEALSALTIHNVEHHQEAFEKLREYVFHLLIFSENQIASAPDSYGFQLLTAFTSEHAALEYIGWLKFNYPKRKLPVLTSVIGEHFFSMLAQTDKEGVVFNCQGPIRPVILPRNTWEWVLLG